MKVNSQKTPSGKLLEGVFYSTILQYYLQISGQEIAMKIICLSKMLKGCSLFFSSYDASRNLYWRLKSNYLKTFASFWSNETKC